MITVRRVKPVSDDGTYRYYLEVSEHAIMDREVADQFPEAEEVLAKKMLGRASKRIQMAQRDGAVRLVRNKE